MKHFFLFGTVACCIVAALLTPKQTARAMEKIDLTGLSCDLNKEQIKKYNAGRCVGRSQGSGQDIVIFDLRKALPSLAELEAFRVENEANRAVLEKRRKLSEQQRVRDGQNFSQYIEDSYQYKVGMAMYRSKSKRYQKLLHSLIKLNQKKQKHPE